MTFKRNLNWALPVIAAVTLNFSNSYKPKICSAPEHIESFEASEPRTNYVGLKLELDYQRNLKKNKIKNIFWYGHCDPFSLWVDLTFKDESCYLDRSDLEELSDAELRKIKSRFTDDAEVKLYTCHATADSIYDGPIAQNISEFFSVGVTGANSWVFARGIRKSTGIDVFFYPATRADYKFHFKTSILDPWYTGESRWIRFKNGRKLD